MKNNNKINEVKEQKIHKEKWTKLGVCNYQKIIYNIMTVEEKDFLLKKKIVIFQCTSYI